LILTITVSDSSLIPGKKCIPIEARVVRWDDRAIYLQACGILLVCLEGVFLDSDSIYKCKFEICNLKLKCFILAYPSGGGTNYSAMFIGAPGGSRWGCAFFCWAGLTSL
jgi:hypothetical protein